MSTPTSPQETISDPLATHKSEQKQEKKLPSWVSQTLKSQEEDSRRRPWKETFGESVDCRLDDGEDLVRIEKSVGGKFDPDCPFRTQGSSLAA